MALPQQIIEQIRDELQDLNEAWGEADKCYHFETDPPHVLFNLNCPAELEARVRGVLSKYTGAHESSSSQH